MQKARDKRIPEPRTPFRVSLLACLATVGVFTLAGLRPEGRIWGCNQWGYFPDWVVPVAAMVGLAVVPALLWWGRGGTHRSSTRIWLAGISWVTVFVPVALAASFYLFRSQIHLYGDGYLRLDTLAMVNPSLRISDFGATTVLKLLYRLMVDSVNQPALVAYQIASIGGGVIFVTAVVFLSRRLIEDRIDRMLFMLAVVTGGYALLFFGYVENYTLFVPAVGIYTLVGMRITGTGRRRWLALPLVMLSMFLHVFGVILLPSLIYLLMSDSKLGRSFKDLRWSVRVLVIVTTGLVLFIGLYTLRSNSHFVRFSLLPIWTNQFTVDGYTMFSTRHLVDCLNLLIQLSPAILITGCLLPFFPIRRFLKEPRFLFLSVLLISSGCAVLVFNPQLGMPRDWDMFGFVGIPLVVFGADLILRARKHISNYRAIMVLVIALQVLALVPRVATQLVPDVAIAHAENWGRTDSRKRLYIYRAVQDYYRRSEQTAKASAMARDWKAQFIEVQLLDEGKQLLNNGQYEEAAARLTRAIKHNPMLSPAYQHLGSCMLSLNRLDSALALFQIADGFNPGNPGILNELGVVYASQGKIEKAERCWRDILQISPHDSEAALNLLRLYSTHGPHDKFVNTLLNVATWPDIPPPAHKLLGDYYRSISRPDDAERHYEKAREAGPH